MTDRPKIDDAEFAVLMLAQWPDEAVPPGLPSRVMADFDRIGAARRRKLGPAIHDLLCALWPGMGLWQPGVVLAASLACGLVVGALTAPSPLAGHVATAVSQTAETVPVLDMLGDLS